MSTRPPCVLCRAHTTIFGKKNGYTLYVCSVCALVFVDPIPQAIDVYGEDYFAGASAGFGYVDYDKDKEPMVPTFEKYLARIAALAQGNTLLDVGAATGFFLHLAREHGFDVYGVEISPFAAARAREKGIRMITGTLADLPESPRFNVITMLDVIEHVKEPREELLRVCSLLEKDGVVIINTPDIGSVYARLMGRRWHLIVPPEHLYYFNRKNIQTLLQECGFEVVSISTVGKRFTLQYIFKMLYMWQGLRIWKYVSNLCEHTWLNRVALPINLRDNMFVIARKKS